MPKEIFYLLAVIAGLATVTQIGVNNQLNHFTQNPAISSLISFLVGTVALVVYVLITSYQSIPQLSALSQLDWWKFSGGLLGVFYIATSIIVAPKIGAANTLGFLVAGQLVFSVIFDHFGFLGFPVKPINIYRVLGIALMIAGVFLVRKF